MALSISSSSMSAAYQPFPKHGKHKHNVVFCEVQKETGKKLEIGSPIIVTEAPKVLKTAASVPCLRANSGLLKAGDVGRSVVYIILFYIFA